MTTRRPLPSESAARAALEELQMAADTTGRKPSVLAVAKRIGLSNTTFRRHFPDLCAEITTSPRPPSAITSTTATAYAKLQHDNVKLRRDNHELSQHLELAIANIQRLTLDNDQLSRALEAARHITRLPTRPKD